METYTTTGYGIHDRGLHRPDLSWSDTMTDELSESVDGGVPKLDLSTTTITPITTATTRPAIGGAGFLPFRP